MSLEMVGQQVGVWGSLQAWSPECLQAAAFRWSLRIGTGVRGSLCLHLGKWPCYPLTSRAALFGSQLFIRKMHRKKRLGPPTCETPCWGRGGAGSRFACGSSSRPHPSRWHREGGMGPTTASLSSDTQSSGRLPFCGPDFLVFVAGYLRHSMRTSRWPHCGAASMKLVWSMVHWDASPGHSPSHVDVCG